MPTYEFECDLCHTVTEAFARVADAPEAIRCDQCGCGVAKRIISRSFFMSTEPAWINGDLRNAIQGDGEPPITTRKELDDYCKKKDIVCVG